MGKEKKSYYSTNFLQGPVLSKGVSWVTFAEALLMGQAPDEGLFMPESGSIPLLNMLDIMKLKSAPYFESAMLVMEKFLDEEIPKDDLCQIVEASYPFDVPLERLHGTRRYVMRLDQGPTASFKDFGARLMARLMSYFRKEGQRLNVLVATSGDTGSAVGEAFKGVEGVDVYILYPQKEVSGRQKKQLDTIGGNIIAIAVDGKFDDCQDMVKVAFTDPDFAEYNLTSANSINIGRILPQIIYYVYAYAQLAKPGESIVFSVPSGNFGNAFACEIARRIGVPVEMLIMAVNENDEFPLFLETGIYKKLSPSKACLSNAMNVGHPSNLARFFELYGGTVDRKGVVWKTPDVEEMRKYIFSISITDADTKKCIQRAWNEYGLLLEPHGAVGWEALERYIKEYRVSPLCVSLETAHPAKFPEEIIELLGFEPELPESMRGIDKRQGEPVQLAGGYKEFKEFLIENLKKEV